MYLDILILAMIQDAPRHGYDIKKRVSSVLGGTVSMNNNVLYPALRRFEADGAVTSTLQPQNGSPDRHVFQLTARGREQLREMLEDFSEKLAEDAPEFLVRLAFFDLLSSDVQRDILDTRTRVLKKEAEHLGEMRRLTDPRRHRYGYELIDFLHGGITRELEWLASLRRKVGRAGSR
jgi:DNA-binding PadR family transcriptional regulator